MTCQCGGKATGDKWHRRRGEPVCAGAREAHNARRRNARAERDGCKRPTGPRAPTADTDALARPWRRGTPLYVPEVDPL